MSRFISAGLATRIAQTVHELGRRQASNFDGCGLPITSRDLLAFLTSSSRLPLSWYATYIDFDVVDSKFCIVSGFAVRVELVSVSLVLGKLM